MLCRTFARLPRRLVFVIAVSCAFVFVPALAAVGPVLPARATGPQTFLITRVADDVDDTNCVVAACTLRQAVNAANANDPGSGQYNTITFNFGTNTQTTTLTHAITIARNVTIMGNGAVYTLIASAGTSQNVFALQAGSNASLVLGSVTISGGNTGVLVPVTSSGALSVHDSALTGSYVGIDASGTGPMTVDRVLFKDASNAALSASHAPVTVTNSTFSGNANGVQQPNGSSATVRVAGTTFSGNGIAVYTDVGTGTLTVTDSIFAASTLHNCFGAITDGGHNLSYGMSGPDTDCPATFTRTSDPLLGALATNGTTNGVQTFALGSGSPAIDTGICAYTDAGGTARTLMLDARGIHRPQGAACDSGNYEVSAPGPQMFIVTRAADDMINAVCADAASGGCTLRQAVNASNVNDPGSGQYNTITFDPATNGQTTGVAFPLTLSKNVTITGNGAANTLIDETKNTMAPSLNSYASLILSGATISKGVTGVYHSGNGSLVVHDSVFTGNVYGIDAEVGGSGPVTVNRVLFSSVTSVALVVNGQHPTTVTNSTFSGNVTGVNTRYSTGASVIAGSTFRGNGIALANPGTASLTVTDSILAANSGNCFGTITDGGHNLAYGRNGADTSCPATFTRTSDPLLGTLAANGASNGVQTFALQVSSPAIDTGTCQYTDASGVMQTLATDARSVSRLQGAGCDIGSYEAVPTPNPTAPTHPAGTPDTGVVAPVPTRHIVVAPPPGTPIPMPQPTRH